MIILTGAAGFIGSCVLARLNEIGRKDILIIDHFGSDADPKRNNLREKRYAEYLDKKDFLNQIVNDRIKGPVDGLLHIGACSSTTLQDARYFQENNFEYSCHLAAWALKHNVRFIYASSAATYGDGSRGYSDDHTLIKQWQPLNLYGQSKQKFDEWIFDHGYINRVVGLKFFNVFGPNEYHKGDMRSVIAKAYDRVAQEGRMQLFKSYRREYGHGEQKRDFIYVKDAVDVVMFFVNNPNVNGIFNVGTGQARTWNDLASALFSAVGKERNIEYVEMPEILKDKYQYFTEAEMTKLRKAGYQKSFIELETAVRDYIQYLNRHSYL